MTTQNMLKRKRRNRILPTLLKMSGGAFSSTRRGSGDIILPSLVYRNDTRKSRRLLSKIQRINKQKKDEEMIENEEILNVVRLLENDGGKLIHEDGNVSSRFTSGHLVQLKSGDDTQGQGGIAEVNSHLFSPLEAAYQANKVVSEVWSSPQSGVTSLYRYTHMDRLVYPPGYLFRRDFSFA